MKAPASPVRVTPTLADPPPALNRRSSTGVPGGGGGGGYPTNVSLDRLTGDSLLSFSYSAASSGSGLNSENQFGKCMKLWQ